jgi:biopolymer transport protein ExbD
MPIVKPGRRFGAAYDSIALKKKAGHGKLSTAAPLMLTPMIDMFVMLTLYLIQQFNATGQILFIDPSIKLPEARRAVELVGNPPLITIANDMIAVQGKQVEETSVLAAKGNWNAPKLEEALKELKQLSNDVQESSGGAIQTEAAQGIIMIQADVTVPYQLVKKVIFIASRVGFARADFAVSRLAEVATAEKPK